MTHGTCYSLTSQLQHSTRTVFIASYLNFRIANMPSSSSENTHASSDLAPEVLIKVENVGKIFCRDLKKSLFYGLKDSMRDLLGWRVASSSTSGNRKLRKDEFWANKGISFELRRGECLGLIGHNGAGKTTLLKMLNGLIKPDAGIIEMRGRVGALIALGAGFNPILTGRENIYINASVIGLSREEIDEKLDEIIDFSEIGKFIDSPVQTYSSGMQVRLGFAVATAINPDILIIDEVLAVGDLGFTIKCLNRMAEIIPNGAVIFVSHSMPFVNRICTHAMLMDHGAEEYYGDNIAHAIEQYIHKFPSSGKTNQGNGGMKVIQTGLRAEPDKPYIYDGSYIHQNGKPLQIELEFQINDPTIREFRAGLIILDQQLREILHCSPNDDQIFKVPVGAKSVKVEAQLPDIYPNSARHTITVSATAADASGNIYCRTTNSAEFLVRAPTVGWAANIVRCPWKVIR